MDLLFSHLITLAIKGLKLKQLSETRFILK